MKYTKSAFNELNMKIINKFASLRLAVTELILNDSRSSKNNFVKHILKCTYSE